MFLKKLLRKAPAVQRVEVDEALLADVAAYLDDVMIPEGARLAPMCADDGRRSESDGFVCEACALPEDFAARLHEPAEPSLLEPDTTGSFGPIPEGPPAPAQDFSAFAMPAAAAPVRGVVGVFAPEPDLSELLANLDEGFSTTLLHLIDARGMTDAQVYKRANMSRQLFSKIRKDPQYRPTKRTVFALAVALELSLDQTEDLLARAGFAISHSDKFDVILEYFIGRGLYDVFAINEVLFAYDQVLLG